METIGFTVQLSIQRPLLEVFDAIVNPSKLSQYFVANSSAPLVEGGEAIWKFAESEQTVPVRVKSIVPAKQIVLEWNGADETYWTTIEILFESLNSESTLVKIEEKGFRRADERHSYQNCMGWTHMLCCMKGFLEYGINLRKGSFVAGECDVK